ncbi:hypothetical protein [Rubrivirga sp. IMCC45206]|uniref:hypothetical protein n=1 Tax=Rubrivirga sp. IMCC45206 TaxID=3391614 RepID=UPI00398FC0CA
MSTPREPPTELRAGHYSAEDLTELAALAIKASGKSKTAAAADLGVSPASVTDATKYPDRNLTDLRTRIIERWGGYAVDGPLYRLRRP